MIYVGVVLLFLIQSMSYQPPPPPDKPQPEPTQAGIVTDTWGVMLTPGSDPDQVADSLGFENLGTIANLPDTYLFRYARSDTSVVRRALATLALTASDSVTWYEQQIAYEYAPQPSTPNTASGLDGLLSTLVVLVIGLLLSIFV